MLRKFVGWLLIVVAIVVAILGVSLPRAQLQWVIYMTNFFDIMIPILAVGALINYIWKSNGCC
ncbi:MAG: hypothetical protein A3C55_03985 [Gammaproteobacteria bacterium RIFCSPHIGHO2_02_FULL_42_13]|nr:MAG: hypothetical protein A3C55_03985 [Gammaproteobacteria bacterium RIFCSPHIGHO2_02_FULL_42_13]OGT67940.1 MAG: hypothetical protein A3H43_02465 [Gammaproteobacteria bacterium RIFCSPLOWO2_02_FULL_42_9]